MSRPGGREKEPGTIPRRPGGREKEPGTILLRPGGREKEPSAALSRGGGRRKESAKVSSRPGGRRRFDRRSLTTLGCVDLRADYGSSPWRVDPSSGNQSQLRPFPLEGRPG